MNVTLKLMISLLITVNCFGAENRVIQVEKDAVLYVSLIEVIVNPEKYSGSRLALTGYLARPSGPFLYITQGHASLNDITSGVPVLEQELESGNCMHHFVRIVGRLATDLSGEYSLTDIEYVRVARSGDSMATTCWQRDEGEGR